MTSSNATQGLLYLHVLLDKEGAWHGLLVESASSGDPRSDMAQALIESARQKGFGSGLTWYFNGPDDLAPPAGLRAALIMNSLIGADSNECRQTHQRWHQANGQLGLVLTGVPKAPAGAPPDFFLASASMARTLPPYSLIGITSQRPVIATDVNSDADREWLHKNGCNLTTSEFLFGRGQVVRKPDVTRLKLLKLLGLLAEDASTAALEDVFKAEPKLAYSLLRLVNSAACAPRSPISSFAQAINILGRRQLQRWLQLLVYADPNDGNRPNPLLQMAALRGRQMESLVAVLPEEMRALLGENPGDAAFMVGSFSLLDILLGLPMTDVLAQLPLPDVVRQALLDLKGPLGQCLRAIAAANSRNYEVANHHFRALDVNAERYLDIQLDALGWAVELATLG